MVKSLIVCEGKNDKEFLEQFLKDLNINKIVIELFGNKSNIFKLEKYERIKDEVGTIYKNILFIFDADNEESDIKYGGYENSEKEIKKLIQNLGFDSCADYYIMCNPTTKSGYLESLLLSTIEYEQRECIEYFLNCSNFKEREHHKAIFNQIYKIGYPNAPYNFSHKNFDELKEKILNLSNFRSKSENN